MYLKCAFGEDERWSMMVERLMAVEQTRCYHSSAIAYRNRASLPIKSIYKSQTHAISRCRSCRRHRRRWRRHHPHSCAHCVHIIYFCWPLKCLFNVLSNIDGRACWYCQLRHIYTRPQPHTFVRIDTHIKIPSRLKTWDTLRTILRRQAKTICPNSTEYSEVHSVYVAWCVCVRCAWTVNCEPYIVHISITKDMIIYHFVYWI